MGGVTYSIDEPIRFDDEGDWRPVLERMDCAIGVLRDNMAETQWRLHLPGGKTFIMRPGTSAAGMTDRELAIELKRILSWASDALQRRCL